ncbi:MAG TPA: HEPN domain-containing protein [Armatimonadota bacterium]|nr:HEPN domain-containing protein [Armatimonadota bacterium]
MNPLTSEWIEKAEGDYASARRERRARVHLNHDAACFHAQQCAEKYLKAALEEAGIAFGRTHDLESLLDLCLPAYPAWAMLRPQLISLSVYAVAFRYPGSSATAAQAAAAVQTVRNLRTRFRDTLALPL